MKKTIFKSVFVSLFVFPAGYGVYTSQQKVEMSDLALANVEALADEEYDEKNGNTIIVLKVMDLIASEEEMRLVN